MILLLEKLANEQILLEKGQLSHEYSVLSDYKELSAIRLLSKLSLFVLWVLSKNDSQSSDTSCTLRPFIKFFLTSERSTWLQKRSIENQGINQIYCPSEKTFSKQILNQIDQITGFSNAILLK